MICAAVNTLQKCGCARLLLSHVKNQACKWLVCQDRNHLQFPYIVSSTITCLRRSCLPDVVRAAGAASTIRRWPCSRA